MAMALDGIKVLDISRYPMTIYCSMIMGDLGADVIWVQEPEPPPARLGDPQTPEEVERAAVFNALGRNKRSIGLNLKTPEAREVFYRLARDADVIMEGFRPGVVKDLGVDYETVRKINPRVIYLSVSGFGQDGPYRNLPGHDSNYISIAGALGLIGERGGRPVFPYNFLADFASGGLVSCIGVLAALMARGKTGVGQYIDLSMTDGVAFMMASAYSEYFNKGIVPQRGEATPSGGQPHHALYETSDGKYITIAALEPKFFQSLCQLLEREDLILHQWNKEKWDELRALLAGAFREKTRDEWFEILSQADIPVGKVYTLDEAVKDPQLLHREMFIDVEDPRWGKVRQIGIPTKLSGTPGSVRRLGPTRGQHTLEILEALGYTRQEMQKLRKAGAVLWED